MEATISSSVRPGAKTSSGRSIMRGSMGLEATIRPSAPNRQMPWRMLPSMVASVTARASAAASASTSAVTSEMETTKPPPGAGSEATSYTRPSAPGRW